MRRVGMQPVTPRHLANRNRIPPCRLDQDVASFIRDHGVKAAHDAGQGNRFSSIGYDQIFSGQLAVDPV